MRNTSKMLTALMTIIVLSSFSNKYANDFIGTYGASSTDPSKIILTIKADHTFYYQDYSANGKKNDIKGKWEHKGQKVILMSNGPAANFHNVWSFVDDGQVAKSRKGLSFYRLCKVEN